MCKRILSEHCTARCWGKVNWCLGGDAGTHASALTGDLCELILVGGLAGVTVWVRGLAGLRPGLPIFSPGRWIGGLVSVNSASVSMSESDSRPEVTLSPASSPARDSCTSSRGLLPAASSATARLWPDTRSRLRLTSTS